MIITILSSCQGVNAGDFPIGSNRFYRVRVMVKVAHKTRDITGFLVWNTDSSFYYSKKKIGFSSFATRDPLVEKFEYANIQSVGLQTGHAAETLLLPAATGMLLGAGLGYANGDDPTNEWFSYTAGDKALAVGAAGLVVGTTIGSIITAAHHHHYNIHGNYRRFQKLVRFMQDREFPKNIQSEIAKEVIFVNP